MKSLFLIGNGFDLAHGIKTSYEDFHQYLKAQYPDVNGDEFTMPESTTIPDGSESYDDNEVVSYLLRLISNTERSGEKWSNLENSLGILDFGEFFDRVIELEDEDGDPDFWKNMYNTQDVASNLVIPTQRISEFFSDWVNTIKIDERIPYKGDFAALMNKESDLFLTFNYTKTLEILYHAKNVYHIHGKQGGELLFGHGNDTDYYDENMGRYTGAENALQQIQVSLRKDTAKAIINNQDFFKRLLSIDKIYSYGFSFSGVDQIYIKEICKRLPTAEITWYLNDYDSQNQREKYKKVIWSCGFKGQFSTYHISK